MRSKPLGGRSRAGQSLVEFALVLPLLFLLIVNVINFGGMLYAWIVVSNAARTGVQYWVMGPSSAHNPNYPTVAAVSTVVTNDLKALPNRASAQIKVCTNKNGTVACTGTGGPSSLISDPEPAMYVLGSVDVTYTYQPLVAAWSFPKLNISATLPPLTIHRRAVMRLE